MDSPSTSMLARAMGIARASKRSRASCGCRRNSSAAGWRASSRRRTASCFGWSIFCAARG